MSYLKICRKYSIYQKYSIKHVCIIKGNKRGNYQKGIISGLTSSTHHYLLLIFTHIILIKTHITSQIKKEHTTFTAQGYFCTLTG